jgi:signal transduction histidine kinase
MVDLGNPEITLNKCTIKNFLDDLIPVLRETLDLDRSKKIELIYDTEISERTVITDRAILSRIIQSLFQNAVNNMDEGYIRIGYNEGCGEVTFFILDSNQDYSKICEFLYTDDLDRTLTRYFDATTAVNIRLAKKLIKLIHGDISVVPNDSGGTGIYISVPVIFDKSPSGTKLKITGSAGR